MVSVTEEVVVACGFERRAVGRLYAITVIDFGVFEGALLRLRAVERAFEEFAFFPPVPGIVPMVLLAQCLTSSKLTGRPRTIIPSS